MNFNARIAVQPVRTGSVQDGMWISPHDRESEVVSLIASLDVAGYAGVMVGRPADGLDFDSDPEFD